MWNKSAAFIEQHQLLSSEGLHLVALSGGADSVALLLIMLRLGYRVEAVHCNFHLRGASRTGTSSLYRISVRSEMCLFI